MSTAQSSFIGGMKKDFSPLISSNDTLTDALNATIITFNGNEYMLQQDIGNGRIETAYLPKGYVPVGIAEHGGIIYVASYNPLTQRSQIGSFPSPERNISSNENGGTTVPLDIDDMSSKDGEWITMVQATNSKLFTMNDIIRPGDSYYIASNIDGNTSINMDENHEQIDSLASNNSTTNGYVRLSLGVQTKDGEISPVRNSQDELPANDWLKNWVSSDDPSALPDASEYDVYNSRIGGTLCVTAELPCIDGISATVGTSIEESDGSSTYSLTVTVIPQYSDLWDINYLKGVRVQVEPLGDAGKHIKSSDNFYKFQGSETEYSFSSTPAESKYSTIDITKNNFGDEDTISTTPFLNLNLDYAGDTDNISGIVNVTVTPVMAAGLVNYLSQTISVDLSQVGSGNININKWQFMTDVDKGITNIKLGIESYPKPNQIITNIILEFYSYTDSNQTTLEPMYTYYLDKTNSYNGTFLINLQNYYIPSREMYYVVFYYTASENTLNGEVNTIFDSNERQYIGYKGLLTTEAYNEYYVSGGTPGTSGAQAEDFSTFEYPTIDADLIVADVDNPSNVSVSRSGFNSAELKPSVPSYTIYTNNNCVTTTTFSIINRADFNKNYHVFDTIDLSNITYRANNSNLYNYDIDTLYTNIIREPASKTLNSVAINQRQNIIIASNIIERFTVSYNSSNTVPAGNIKQFKKLSNIVNYDKALFVTTGVWYSGGGSQTKARIALTTRVNPTEITDGAVIGYELTDSQNDCTFYCIDATLWTEYVKTTDFAFSPDNGWAGIGWSPNPRYLDLNGNIPAGEGIDRSSFGSSSGTSFLKYLSDALDTFCFVPVKFSDSVSSSGSNRVSGGLQWGWKTTNEHGDNGVTLAYKQGSQIKFMDYALDTNNIANEYANDCLYSIEYASSSMYYPTVTPSPYNYTQTISLYKVGDIGVTHNYLKGSTTYNNELIENWTTKLGTKLDRTITTPTVFTDLQELYPFGDKTTVTIEYVISSDNFSSLTEVYNRLQNSTYIGKGDSGVTDAMLTYVDVYDSEVDENTLYIKIYDNRGANPKLIKKGSSNFSRVMSSNITELTQLLDLISVNGDTISIADVGVTPKLPAQVTNSDYMCGVSLNGNSVNIEVKERVVFCPAVATGVLPGTETFMKILMRGRN